VLKAKCTKYWQISFFLPYNLEIKEDLKSDSLFTVNRNFLVIISPITILLGNLNILKLRCFYSQFKSIAFESTHREP
jgi:hypothetical protein